ncbi:MAG: type II secretion system F family protein [Tessaracoccus sp.]|uniref:hypothetical protein n=1 Tax=Tessaracoccus sp. TaxID=1971211 RepID=UPI001ECD1331|nr:hypothetical protein [Tessaracoccus sp.]MBK7822107.1 type II secretion system F family protein [Tessaracoccus sp.]
MIGLMTAAGMVVGLGIFLVVRGALAQPVRLGDALAALETRLPVAEEPLAGGLEGLSERLRRKLRLPLTTNQQRMLSLQGRSVGDFFAEKLVWTAMGFLLPALWGGLQLAVGRSPGLTPVGLSLVGAVAGFFVADLRLRGGAEQQRRAATDGIHTFFDLVVLERLANASAAQAAANAAAVSSSPLFRRISAGLERARMEQAPPWDELRRVADEWNVPELTDFADVMQLEEQGAGLAEVLQARVRELRDAHLSAQRSAAQEASEAMTLWMTIPALLLGVALLVPALLGLLT